MDNLRHNLYFCSQMQVSNRQIYGTTLWLSAMYYSLQ